jgi:predicted acyltransferase (DUF342 family)
MGVLGCLLRCQNIYEAFAEIVKAIGPGNMTIERCRIELGKNEDAANIGIDAIAQGNIDDAVLPGQRNSGFGSMTGEGKKPFAFAASENQS